MGIKLIVFLVLGISMEMISHRVLANESFSRQRSKDVESNGNLRNTIAVKSIQSEDGDIIDCIDIYKQPAFDHPALKNHKIQMKPNFVLKKDITTFTNKTKTTHEKRKGRKPILVPVTTQLWQRNGSCPDGTVPIRRMSKNYNAYEARKPPSFFNQSKLQRQDYSKAVMLTVGYAYIGAKADIYLWNPRVELDTEFTTSRVTLLSGPRHDFEAIEAGWTVNPKVYKDRKTRFFVYWTLDASIKTGCFDLFCPGFVQISKDIALGAVIDPIKSPLGLPNPITIFMLKDIKTDNWWIKYGDQVIGYWPRELLPMISQHAEAVEWGGEVYSKRIGEVHPHTSTEMGGGGYAFIDVDSSGLIRNFRIVDNSRFLKLPKDLGSLSDEVGCYGDYIYYPDAGEPEFYYGGPGRNSECP